MAFKHICVVFIVLTFARLSAQQLPVQLDEVTIADYQRTDFSESKTVDVLPDSIIRRNASMLSSLLQYESTLYFKENGPGMVSSASFRGTTAQQTAVIWNGININSQLNGQTDFNTLITRDFSSISVRAGGGSLLYGSSAIGGTVHLDTELSYKPVNTHFVDLSYGSFESVSANYQYKYSNNRLGTVISASNVSSDNDFSYPGTDRHNENGQYNNSAVNSVVGCRLGTHSDLKVYSYIFIGDRHFSLISPTDNRTKYRDFKTRNLLEWRFSGGSLRSDIKLALLTEQYRYYENIDQDNYFTGQVLTWVGRYNLAWDMGNGLRLDSGIELTDSAGKGSDIDESGRETASPNVQFSQRISKKLVYELGLRRDFSSVFESPLLYSAGARYKMSDLYEIKGSFSKNFRAPTFNDLYWNPGGNPDIRPEISVQAELSNNFSYGSWDINLTLYHNRITDMIRWLPGPGFSSPSNEDKVTINGVETKLSHRVRLGSHHIIWSALYTYTSSKNEGSGKQLIYTPYHKAAASLQYEIARISVRYQHLFTSSVFTQSDNDPEEIVGLYNVSNADINYSFFKKKNTALGIRMLNIWNETYESVDGRFFPGRNFNLYLTLNI